MKKAITARLLGTILPLDPSLSAELGLWVPLGSPKVSSMAGNFSKFLTQNAYFVQKAYFTNLGVPKPTVRFEIWGQSGDGFAQWKAYNMAKDSAVNNSTKRIYLHSVVEFVSF